MDGSAPKSPMGSQIFGAVDDLSAWIMTQIDGLADDYPPPPMGVDQRAQWHQRWVEILRPYSCDAIAEGLKAYRLSDTPKKRFPDYPVLVALVQQAHRRSQRVQGERPVRTDDWWWSVTPEQEAAMSLSDRLYYLDILASQLRMKAGPQWGSGKPIPAEQMPERWHRLRAEADQIAERAARVRQQLVAIKQRRI